MRRKRTASYRAAIALLLARCKEARNERSKIADVQYGVRTLMESERWRASFRHVLTRSA